MKAYNFSQQKALKSSEYTFGELSADDVKKLLKCPIKKRLIIDIITSEKDKIEAYKKDLEDKNVIKTSSPLKKAQKSYESPSSLLRKRLQQQMQNTDSDSESSTTSSISKKSVASSALTPVSFDKILCNIIAFVEVRSGEIDRSKGVKILLESMGATVRDKFTNDVTHVIYKDGTFDTYQKAILINAKLVSVLWLEACKTKGKQVPEKDFPALGILKGNQNHNASTLCSQIQKEYEEIIEEEFNKSIAMGEPLPSVKSLIKKRSPIKQGLSHINLFPQETEDIEVANLIDKANSEPAKKCSTSNSLFEEDSDTGAVVSFICNKEENHIYQKTSTTLEDMELTNMKENAVENRDTLSPIISSQLENFFEEKTRHEMSINKTSLTKNQEINQKEIEKSPESTMSSLRVTNRSKNSSKNSSRNSFSPLPAYKINNIMQHILSDEEPSFRDHITHRKKTKISSKEDIGNVTFPQALNTYKSKTTSQKKSCRLSKNTSIEKNCVDVSSINKKLDKTTNETKDVKALNGTYLKLRRRTLGCFKQSTVTKNIKTPDTKNKRRTISSESNSTIKVGSKKIKMTEEELQSSESQNIEKELNNEKNEALNQNNFSNKKKYSNLAEYTYNDTDLQISKKSRRHSIAFSPKLKAKHISGGRKSIGVLETKPNSSDDLKMAKENIRRIRKLYNPNDPPLIQISDELEKEGIKQNKKISDDDVFINPFAILSDKTKETENQINDETGIDSSVENSLLEIKQKNTRKKNKKIKEKSIITSDSNDDEQIMLKNLILNNQKNSIYSSTENLTIKVTKWKTNNISDQSKENSPKVKNKEPETMLTPTTPRLKRRSTMEFQSNSITNSKKKLKIYKMQTPTIVCTKMIKEDIQVFTQIVNKLGKFNIEGKVSNRTTHLVAGEPKRTINMLRALARGCWVLKKEWLSQSLEAGKWLPEEDFEETDFSPAVQKNRLLRQAFGPSFTTDLFQDCGLIYISQGTNPKCSELEELVLLGKGKITKIARNAKIIVGEFKNREDVICVSEIWILDCFSLNKIVSFKKYLLSNKRKSIMV